jgi:hypothetical protein
MNEGKIDGNQNDLYFAIQQGNLDIVQYMIEEGHVRPTQDHFNTAVQQGNPDIIKILTERTASIN